MKLSIEDVVNFTPISREVVNAIGFFFFVVCHLLMLVFKSLENRRKNQEGIRGVRLAINEVPVFYKRS